eukprot:s2772_g1.t1
MTRSLLRCWRSGQSRRGRAPGKHRPGCYKESSLKVLKDRREEAVKHLKRSQELGKELRDIQVLNSTTSAVSCPFGSRRNHGSTQERKPAARPGYDDQRNFLRP